MRTALLAAIASLGLLGMPVASHAAPAMPQAVVNSHADIVQVRGGCGRGWHQQSWRDRWGRWHRRCVPNHRRRW
jgi:hypothetical protein